MRQWHRHYLCGSFSKTKGSEYAVSDYIYWIWLSLAGGSANPDYALLLEHFKDAKSIFDADISEYSKVEGLNKKFASRLCEKDLEPAREIYEFCESRSVRLLHCSEPDYPVKLKWIYAYPVLSAAPFPLFTS